MTYQKVNAQVNGQPIPAYDVNNDTYLHWTVLNMLGITFQHPSYGVLVFGGKTVQGVVCDGVATYINYKDVPGIIPQPLDGGGWNFVTSSTPVAKTQLCVIKGDVVQDAFYFSWDGGPAHMILDTGAYRCVVDKDIATAMGMPNLGPCTDGGIGGTQTGFTSKLHVKLGTYEFDTECSCLPFGGAGGGLFGFKAFEEQNLSFYLDIHQAELTIYK